MTYRFELVNPREPGKNHILPLWTEPAFLRAIAALHGLDVYHLICMKGNEIAAIIPVFERQKLGIRHQILPVMAYYQPLSVYHDPGASDARRLLDELQITNGIADFLKARYKRITFNLDPRVTDIRGFSWSGLSAMPLYTFVYSEGDKLDPIRDEAEKLKKAEKRGYVHDDRFAPNEFLTLLRSLYDRKGHKLGVSFERLERFIQDLHAAGLLIQDNILQGDRIVSSDLIYAKPGGMAYAIMRATAPEEMTWGISSFHTKLMLGSLIPRYQAVDFCGANIRDVARFKAALGLKLKVFYRITGKGGLL